MGGSSAGPGEGYTRTMSRQRAGRSVPNVPPSALGADGASRVFERLARHGALHTLVRAALPSSLLRELLKDAMPRSAAREMPPEVWASLAVGIALESPTFGGPLAQALHDRLAWDQEPADLDAWWRLVVEKPLEALWMAALSGAKDVRKEFPHIVEHCLENYRSSPGCKPPSWEFVDGLLDVQASTASQLKHAERRADDAERRYEAERDRLADLREELKRLRRETSELRAHKAEAGRRAESLAEEARSRGSSEEVGRLRQLERGLLRAEKEREHLLRELQRLRDDAARRMDQEPAISGRDPALREDATKQPPPADTPTEDPAPRQRLVRELLRRLLKKGKIGASHTHEDNVYKSVADHEKGIVKETMELLYREGLLLPKPTATDPHVSLNPERLAEIHAIIAGRILNPRLQQFIGG